MNSPGPARRLTLLALCAVVPSLSLASCDSDDATPAAATTPTANEHGVDPTMWTELSWLPASVMDIGRFADPMPIVQWLKALKLDEDGHCVKALDAITHYYMVGFPSAEDPQADSTLLFLGGPSIDEAMQCGEKFSTRLGFSVARDDAKQRITITQVPPEGVTVEGGPGSFAAQWVEKNGTTIVIADQAERIEALLAGSGSLDDPEGARLRARLGEVQSGEGAAPWIAGRQDVSAFWLDVPGEGYVATTMQTREAMVVMGELVFATRADAEKAEKNVGGLYADAKLLDPDFAGYAELVPAPSPRLRFRAEVPVELAALPPLEAAMTKLRELKAKAAAEGRTLGPDDLKAPPAPAPPSGAEAHGPNDGHDHGPPPTPGAAPTTPDPAAAPEPAPTPAPAP